MIRKILLIPWFGPLPDWMPHWEANVEKALLEHGYAVAFEHDLPDFKKRVKRKLGVDCPIVPGEGKIHDYRAALGMLYAEEIAGYDFWGHTDLDVVYGRVHRWVTDEFLDGLDIHSNHVDYIAGPWSLYRNRPEVNVLFTEHPDWREILEQPDVTGWVETGFTEVVDAAHRAGAIARRYTMWQTANLDGFDTLKLMEDGRLLEGRREVMVAHFRRTKIYPVGCRR